MKHTTGEWELSIDGSTICHAHEIHAEEKVIAHVENWDGEMNEIQEEALANAKLMTEAPKLLTMLMKAESMIFYLMNRTGLKSSELPDYHDTMPDIRQVIQEATY